MPFFGRRKKVATPVVRPPADPDLPALDVDQAARLRALTHAELSGRGLETLVFPDHLTVDGHTFGLHNLSATVADEDPATWPDKVRRHFDLMLEADDDPQYGLSDAELEAAVHVRLVQPAPEIRSMFSRFGDRVPGLVAVPCVDLPQKVAFPPETFYEERGGFDRWWKLGFDNLESTLWESELEHVVVGLEDPVPRHDIVTGDSVYVASFALLLPHLLARFDQADLGRGVLVTMPERMGIAFRVVDGAEALPAIAELAKLALPAYRTGAGALSPHVFLVNQNGWHQLTQIEDDTIKIMINEEVAAAFDLDPPSEVERG